MGDRSGEWGWPGEDGVLLPPEKVSHHLGPVWSSPILLEDDPFEVRKIVGDGGHQLVLQDGQVRGSVNTLWEAAGGSNSLAGQAPPNLKFVTPKLGHWLHHLGVQLLPRESPHKSPLDCLVGMEGGLVAEDYVVPEVGWLLGVFLGPLKARMALRSGEAWLPPHPARVETSAVKSSSHRLGRDLGAE